MSTHKNIGFETQQPSASGTSGCISELQISIGRWLADQYSSDIPERLASLLEHLADTRTASISAWFLRRFPRLTVVAGAGHTNPGPFAQAQGCAALGETKVIFTTFRRPGKVIPQSSKVDYGAGGTDRNTDAKKACSRQFAASAGKGTR
jgi:hypothetical protein